MAGHCSKSRISDLVPLRYTEDIVTQIYDKLSPCSSFPGGQFVARDGGDCGSVGRGFNEGAWPLGVPEGLNRATLGCSLLLT